MDSTETAYQVLREAVKEAWVLYSREEVAEIVREAFDDMDNDASDDDE